ncbi:hypothetical protein GCM10010401_08020 [Rarobacter faecitabidus]|uniref:Sec-independent protein translocase protein TatA n=1 Tax=Rarobacter faecitabidus TaxID=13243 RepID=A0A542ZAP6_RARFA|nr:twin-arginine translocase TatA/TatE family subunit [Rarobacter faecitabidus]TQL57409.1 sec-independent protein translocase protein TatA [Rarobacter faecitabidus]
MNLFRNPSHVIILVAVLVVVFGAARLPMLAKNVGQSLKIFRKEVRELSLDASPAESDETQTAQNPK